ncbi:Fc.00g090190.m01.CDS01 [Cosmosporella sp. VM-42]
MSQPIIDEEDLTTRACCDPLFSLTAPIDVNKIESGHTTFFHWPLFGPLLFENESSDARDHCANERTFLSYLRLSVYMAIVSVAITLSFHLKNEPTRLELRMAKPLGSIFWALSVLTLFVGLGNYITTINKYSKKAAIVQSGWKTHAIMTVTAVCIVGTCLILLVIAKIRDSSKSQ